MYGAVLVVCSNCINTSVRNPELKVGNIVLLSLIRDLNVTEIVLTDYFVHLPQYLQINNKNLASDSPVTNKKQELFISNNI